MCARLFFRDRSVIMCGENRTKELIHCAEDDKLVSLVFEVEASKMDQTMRLISVQDSGK